MLQHNPYLYTSKVYCKRINDMRTRLDEWSERVEEL